MPGRVLKTIARFRRKSPGFHPPFPAVGIAVAFRLIGFNSGVYEEIDLSEWMAGNPVDVLATNFGKPEAVFQRFPRRDVFIADRNGR